MTQTASPLAIPAWYNVGKLDHPKLQVLCQGTCLCRHVHHVTCDLNVAEDSYELSPTQACYIVEVDLAFLVFLPLCPE